MADLTVYPHLFGEVITPSDTDLIGPRPACIYIESGDGDVVLGDEQGRTLVWNTAEGRLPPFRPTRVLATGTTPGLVIKAAWNV